MIDILALRKFRRWREQQKFTSPVIALHAAIVEQAITSILHPAGQAPLLKRRLATDLEVLEKMIASQ